MEFRGGGSLKYYVHHVYHFLVYHVFILATAAYATPSPGVGTFRTDTDTDTVYGYMPIEIVNLGYSGVIFLRFKSKF